MGQTRCVASTISAPYALGKRWRALWATLHPPTSITGFSAREAVGSIAISSTEASIFKKFVAFELTRLLLICVAIWVPEIPRAPNTR